MGVSSVRLVPAPADGILPDGFFVTSNRRTWIKLKGEEIEVKDIRMDCCIVVDEDKKLAICMEPRKVKKGMLVVVGKEGVREEGLFRFMKEQISPERPAYVAIEEIARKMLEIKRKG
ncbi:MAG: TIGR00300 family protein, partial [Thermoprotei archaeon]